MNGSNLSSTAKTVDPDTSSLKSEEARCSECIGINCLSSDKEIGVSACSNAPGRPPRLFGSSADFEENNFSDQSSTASLLQAHMTKPCAPEIKEWMTESQQTVDKLVTNWQQTLIDRSSKISDLLDQLVEFVEELQTNPSHSSSSSVNILRGKCINRQGSFESVTNVYLHLILLSLKEVVASTLETQNDVQEEHRKTSVKRIRRQQRRLLIDILNRFLIVAEDALKFLQTHRKLLAPACAKVLTMRNNLYCFLQKIITHPHKQIIPPTGFVSLERIRRAEDKFWLESNCIAFTTQVEEVRSYLEVNVGARTYSILVRSRDTEDEEAINVNISDTERLELVLLLLKQLNDSIGGSNEGLKNSHYEFLETHARLQHKFQRLSREFIVQSKQDRLQCENCSEPLKESLCQLEVKFYHLEKVIEEIPQHLKRVIGVADQCSRQLIQHLEVLEVDVQLSDMALLTSPIEDLMNEFFKAKKGRNVPGCFPVLWKIIARIVFGGGVGDIGTSKKVKAFWEEVRTEMEDFCKEIKIKELEKDYGIVLKLPISCDAKSYNSKQPTRIYELAKYA